MGKYVIRHATGDEDGTVFDVDSLRRWIDDIRQVDAISRHSPLCGYVAERIADLIDYDEPAS